MTVEFVYIHNRRLLEASTYVRSILAAARNKRVVVLVVLHGVCGSEGKHHIPGVSVLARCCCPCWRSWPRLTILGQSVGSMAVAFQALRQLSPDVFLDTTGYAFTYILAKLLCSAKVATYTHYPTITSVRRGAGNTPFRFFKSWRSTDGFAMVAPPDSRLHVVLGLFG